MADVIVRHFGKVYKEKYHKPIESVIHLETEARNTIENLTLVLNKYPKLLGSDKRIGFLSAGHHLERCAIIAHRFDIFEAKGGRLSAQKILYGEANNEDREEHLGILDDLAHKELSPSMKEQVHNEQRWIKAFEDPSYITYWFGFTFELEDPKRIVDVLHQFSSAKWHSAMQEAFLKVGLDFDSFTALDLQKLVKSDYQSYSQLRDRLLLLTSPENRHLEAIM